MASATVNQIVGSFRNGTLMFRRISGLLYSSSFQNCLTPINDKQISSSSRVMKILTESTTIIQDGITMEELPILIRLATRDTYPFTSHSYCGENIREENEFNISFKEMLEGCVSVSDVFNLLEVPSDKIQGHSAVYALQSLHALMLLNSDWKQIHSFIRRAVIGELYQIVERDIHCLSNCSLVTLIDCSFAVEGFSSTCSEAINEEISHRLVEGLFTVEELLSLVQSLRTGIRNNNNNMNKSTGTSGQISDQNNSSLNDVLSENASVYLPMNSSKSTENNSSESHGSIEDYLKYQELLRNVWVHLASRCNDMDENTLPWMMQLLSSDNKMLIPLLDKRFTHVWHQLSADTAAMCLDNLVRLRSYNSSMMTKLGWWAFINIHLMTPSVLLSFLNVYLHFSFTDNNLIQVMEKCISKTGSDTPTDLLALCVEYLHSCKFVSPIVMDVAADHFTLHWESYSPLEIFAMLRSFGHLSYLPVKPQEFLFKVETCLDKRFDIMNEVHLLEVLASFTFINILPRNFFKKVSSDYFYKKVGAMNSHNKRNALMWLKVMKQAIIFGLSQEASTDKHREWVMSRKKRWSVFVFQDDEKIAIVNLKSALDQLFGKEYHHVIPFYSCCAVYLDEKGLPIKISCEDGYPKPVEVPHQRLVILLRRASHITINTKQLLGAQRQRMDHLKKLGYVTVEIRAGEFHCQSGTNIIKSHLSHHIDFQNPKIMACKERHLMELEEKYDAYIKDWIEEGEEEEDDNIVDNNVEGFLACSDFQQNRKDFSLPSSVTDDEMD